MNLLNNIPKSGVYSITCKTNNRKYIGSSTRIIKRWYSHKSELKHNKHKNKLLQEDYNLYGISNFIFETIEFVTVNLTDKERYWITELKTDVEGYNISLPKTTTEEAKHSDKTKQLLSENKLEFIKNNPIQYYNDLKAAQKANKKAQEDKVYKRNYIIRATKDSTTIEDKSLTGLAIKLNMNWKRIQEAIKGEKIVYNKNKKYISKIYEVNGWKFEKIKL